MSRHRLVQQKSFQDEFGYDDDENDDDDDEHADDDDTGTVVLACDVSR